MTQLASIETPHVCSHCGEQVVIEREEAECTLCRGNDEPGFCWRCRGTGYYEDETYVCGCWDEESEGT